MMSDARGVYTAKKKNGDVYYRASFTFRGRHISLGSYVSASEANAAYTEALALSSSSLSVSDYTDSTSLPFVKWVVIINFRDNGLYIKTPIYLKKNMFYYYLDENEVYTFDAEDLFFYSTHKIMKRGGHLFVADFGMQINIASRYGIKNYAIEGKDYYFINGDDHDYRYSNISVINRYNGVAVHGRGTAGEHYVAKIHIRGDYIIGRYETETEAAVAYNKAVDVLLEKGVMKHYEKNYIESLSSTDYNFIYQNINISNKITEICEKS